MREQANAVTSYSVGPAVPQLFFQLGWKNSCILLQQQLQLLPCRAKGILVCLVAFLVWKGKWDFEFSEQMRMVFLPNLLMRCQWQWSHKDVLKSFCSLFEILSDSYRQIFWEVMLQSPHVHVAYTDMVVQSHCQSTAPPVPNRLLHQRAASSKDKDVSS